MNNLGLVIPAFNEADNLARVLDVSSAVDRFTQIVVVDDGSDDHTLTIAQQYAQRDRRVVARRLPQNRGKAAAMLAGAQALQTDFVLFLDADLIGLRPGHLEQLYEPVLAGQSDMSVAVFRHGRLLTDASHRLTPYLSGQRCLRRQAAEDVLRSLAGSRYGAETGLAYHAQKMGWRCLYIPWEGVTHVMKEMKRGYRAGLNTRWRMYTQILATMALLTGTAWRWQIFWKQAGGKHLFTWQAVAMVVLVMLVLWFMTYDPSR
jgi:glycosyltransferase involved in cell wall biosynthesis